MKEKITVKRYVLCIVGLMITGFGVAVTKKGELGVSPVSSVANILSLKFDFMTLGNWLVVWNSLLILGQILLLRKKFQIFQLLQLPLSFLFGMFTDAGLAVLSGLQVKTYGTQIFLVFLGTAIVALGVSVSVVADVIYNSGEAFVKAVSETFHKDFGTLKVVFDVSCVVIAVVLSLIFFPMQIRGTREGTVIAALLTGVLVKQFVKVVRKLA